MMIKIHRRKLASFRPKIVSLSIPVTICQDRIKLYRAPGVNFWGPMLFRTSDFDFAADLQVGMLMTGGPLSPNATQLACYVDCR